MDRNTIGTLISKCKGIVTAAWRITNVPNIVKSRAMEQIKACHANLTGILEVIPKEDDCEAYEIGSIHRLRDWNRNVGHILEDSTRMKTKARDIIACATRLTNAWSFDNDRNRLDVMIMKSAMLPGNFFNMGNIDPDKPFAIIQSIHAVEDALRLLEAHDMIVRNTDPNSDAGLLLRHDLEAAAGRVMTMTFIAKQHDPVRNHPGLKEALDIAGKSAAGAGKQDDDVIPVSQAIEAFERFLVWERMG